MTRKHFIALAAELRRQKPSEDDYTTTSAVGNNTFFNGIRYEGAYNEWARIVIGIAGTFAQFNGGFDRSRFLGACGLVDR